MKLQPIGMKRHPSGAIIIVYPERKCAGSDTWRKSGSLTPGGMHNPFPVVRESFQQRMARIVPNTIHRIQQFR